MQLRTDYTYAIACPTSMGVRLSPADRMPVHTADLFTLQATSAETNVLNVSASLGMRCLALTRFVEGSPIAEYIRRQLRARGIEYLGPEIAPEGPWGMRHQFNIADAGFGLRAARVWNDRAGEVGRTLSLADYDTEDIFGRQGVALLHLSGLIAAMSPDTAACCVGLAEAAKQHDTLVSFDLNYRASFWKDREQELRQVFHRLASLADILVGNEEDYQLCLGLDGPETGGKDLASKVESFQQMIGRAKAAYPNARVFATTLREVLSANRNLWGALLLAGNQLYVEEPRPIDILDRIGGGDGFTGGLLYGILKGWTPDRWLAFGWACGAMAAGSLHDYAEPADEKQVWDLYAGNARVQR